MNNNMSSFDGQSVPNLGQEKLIFGRIENILEYAAEIRNIANNAIQQGFEEGDNSITLFSGCGHAIGDILVDYIKETKNLISINFASKINKSGLKFTLHKNQKRNLDNLEDSSKFYNTIKDYANLEFWTETPDKTGLTGLKIINDNKLITVDSSFAALTRSLIFDSNGKLIDCKNSHRDKPIECSKFEKAISDPVILQGLQQIYSLSNSKNRSFN